MKKTRSVHRRAANRRLVAPESLEDRAMMAFASWLPIEPAPYDVAANWSNGVVPNNGTPAATDTYHLNLSQEGVRVINFPAGTTHSVSSITVSDGNYTLQSPKHRYTVQFSSSELETFPEAPSLLVGLIAGRLAVFNLTGELIDPPVGAVPPDNPPNFITHGTLVAPDEFTWANVTLDKQRWDEMRSLSIGAGQASNGQVSVQNAQLVVVEALVVGVGGQGSVGASESFLLATNMVVGGSNDQFTTGGYGLVALGATTLNVHQNLRIATDNSAGTIQASSTEIDVGGDMIVGAGTLEYMESFGDVELDFSDVNVHRDLTVGEYAAGFLSATNESKLTVHGDATVGKHGAVHEASDGQINLNDASQFTISQALTIAQFGSGRVYVWNNSKLETGSLAIAGPIELGGNGIASTAIVGELNVNASTVLVRQDANIGVYGDGSLIADNESDIKLNGKVAVGLRTMAGSASAGVIELDGESTLVVSHDNILKLGVEGVGRLSVLGGSSFQGREAHPEPDAEGNPPLPPPAGTPKPADVELGSLSGSLGKIEVGGENSIARIAKLSHGMEGAGYIDISDHGWLITSERVEAGGVVSRSDISTSGRWFAKQPLLLRGPVGPMDEPTTLNVLSNGQLVGIGSEGYIELARMTHVSGTNSVIRAEESFIKAIQGSVRVDNQGMIKTGIFAISSDWDSVTVDVAGAGSRIEVSDQLEIEGKVSELTIREGAQVVADKAQMATTLGVAAKLRFFRVLCGWFISVAGGKLPCKTWNCIG